MTDLEKSKEPPKKPILSRGFLRNTGALAAASVSLLAPNLAPAAAAGKNVSAQEIEAKTPRPPESFPVFRHSISPEQKILQQKSDLILAVKTVSADGQTIAYRCNANRIIYEGDSNTVLSDRHCIIPDIIEHSSQPNGEVPQASSNYINAVEHTTVELLDPLDHSLVRGTASAIIASNREDFLLLKVTPGTGWEEVSAINLDKSVPKAAVGEHVYIYGGGDSNNFQPQAASGINLGKVHYSNFYQKDAIYDAIGIPEGPAAKADCLKGESGTVAGTASGYFSGGLYANFYLDPKYKIGKELPAPPQIINQIERLNGISTKGFGEICLFNSMRFDTLGSNNLTLQQLVAGETNLVLPLNKSS